MMSATFTIETVDDEVVELGEVIEVSSDRAVTVVDDEPDPVRTGAPARTMIVDNDGAVEVFVMTNGRSGRSWPRASPADIHGGTIGYGSGR